MQVVSGYDNPAISIFPNSLTQNYFTINLNKNLPDKYRISILSLKGDQLFKTIVNLSFVHATKKVQLSTSLIAGTYFVKFTKKINN